ncbi:ABC transporter permease, partial [Klebsiella pneumoniae]
MTETLDRPPVRPRSTGTRRRPSVDIRLLGLTGVLVL